MKKYNPKIILCGLLLFVALILTYGFIDQKKVNEEQLLGYTTYFMGSTLAQQRCMSAEEKGKFAISFLKLAAPEEGMIFDMRLERRNRLLQNKKNGTLTDKEKLSFTDDMQGNPNLIVGDFRKFLSKSKFSVEDESLPFVWFGSNFEGSNEFQIVYDDGYTRFVIPQKTWDEIVIRKFNSLEKSTITGVIHNLRDQSLKDPLTASNCVTSP